MPLLRKVDDEAWEHLIAFCEDAPVPLWFPAVAAAILMSTMTGAWQGLGEYDSFCSASISHWCVGTRCRIHPLTVSSPTGNRMAVLPADFEPTCHDGLLSFGTVEDPDFVGRFVRLYKQCPLSVVRRLESTSFVAIVIHRDNIDLQAMLPNMSRNYMQARSKCELRWV